METHKTQFQVFLVLLLALCINTKAQDESIPSVESVMDRYVAATGGLNAYDKITTRFTKSELSGQGFIFNVGMYQKKPDMVYTLLESAATGKIENGTDGNTVWTISELTGPLVQEGKDRDQFLAGAWLDQFAYWRNSFKGAKFIGIVRVNDQYCYEIEVFSNDMYPIKIFYQTNTGLILKTERTVSSAIGEIRIETFLSDYRNTDGILIPFETKIMMDGQERVSRVVEIKNNISIGDGTFLPGIIKELILKN